MRTSGSLLGTLIGAACVALPLWLARGAQEAGERFDERVDSGPALARFEEQFTYPLGPGRTLRISHGDDYPRFFRAIGDAACFVAERSGAC